MLPEESNDPTFDAAQSAALIRAFCGGDIDVHRAYRSAGIPPQQALEAYVNWLDREENREGDFKTFILAENHHIRDFLTRWH